MKIHTGKNHVGIEGKNKRNLFFQRGKIISFYMLSGCAVEEIMVEKNNLSTERSLIYGGIITRKKKNKLLCSFGKNKGVQ